MIEDEEAAREEVAREAEAERLADEIYTSLYGHLDDKYFRAAKHQEIYEWLVTGDWAHVVATPVEALARERQEYEAGDV